MEERESKMNKEKAVVVFSGGQDSTTCLFWAKKRFKEVIALSFDYNQKHKLELECAKAICEKHDVEFHILNLDLLNQLAPNSLTRKDIAVDKDAPEEGPPNTFVDGRNLLFLTFAAIFAKQRGINTLITGVSQSDFSGYPDCRDVFIKSLNVTLNLAIDFPFDILTPLMWINKEETWKMAHDLGVLEIIKEETLTCYNGLKGRGCGECPACKLREKGYLEFEKNYLKKIKKTIDKIK
ncbi:7-cyano-7-deazaguanine synthase QueC [Cellulosilyticum sp. I15G10I2]|uniref:7-cyano-7-deazaguanine synthase QueC n=1 Tax=Cellulosilyticum sp. I15G10I2 TaxID=1892843 RepID=UPI002101A9EF